MTGSLRVLQVMRAPVGGLFRHVADLTRGLHARGHHVGLVVDSLAGDAQTGDRLAALKQFADLGIHLLPMPRLLGSGDLSTPLAVRRLARELDADILHGHGAKGGLYARLARLGSNRTASLYTPHGGVLHFGAGSTSGKLFHWLERRLMAQTDALIFESEFARNTYARIIAEPTCRTEVIFNGLDPAEFAPLSQGEDKHDFVFVGELRDLKGIFPLIEAMTRLRRPDGDAATLVMAGDGPQRSALEARIAELSLGDRVRLVGSQPARSVFAQARFAVVPSLAESLPYVVMEATAARLPVVATHVGGIPEICDGTTDTLVTPGDAEALRRAMQAMLDQPEMAEAEMEKRLARVRAQFSVETMVERIAALYRQVLRQS
ncbi:Glycosyltransferase involved in cell wall bisynthesis [Devosia crocina]|uniref:Glycosyltransferase involved in cell wall bisynthesis n=1 Tax=Devosia crocina TaxID=429728 RepID=A0A1I7NJN8_9HYPH|nr:glycosyltransferase [Devosia crocina]SFV34857.1 Glycosyltransferase involved in cell wall bisynthesis [Devosia crocina]